MSFQFQEVHRRANEESIMGKEGEEGRMEMGSQEGQSNNTNEQQDGGGGTQATLLSLLTRQNSSTYERFGALFILLRKRFWVVGFPGKWSLHY